MDIELAKSITLAILSSTALNAVVTHFLYSSKLRKDLKFHGNNEIAQSISNSLQEFRKIVLELKKYEVFGIEQRLKNDPYSINFINGEPKYPACFNDKDSLTTIINRIRKCREEYECFMPCRIALNLVFIERYFMHLLIFLKGMSDSALPLLGTILVYDIDKWIRRIDILLVKEINKYSYRLESHESFKWRVLRITELVKQYDNTILSYLITGNCPFRQRKLMKSVDELIDGLLKDVNCKQNKE